MCFSLPPLGSCIQECSHLHFKGLQQQIKGVLYFLNQQDKNRTRIRKYWSLPHAQLQLPNLQCAVRAVLVKCSEWLCDANIVCLLTRELKSWACHSSQSSLSVYSALPVTQSTGPLAICCVRALTITNRCWPTVSCQRQKEELSWSNKI